MIVVFATTLILYACKPDFLSLLKKMLTVTKKVGPGYIRLTDV